MLQSTRRSLQLRACLHSRHRAFSPRHNSTTAEETLRTPFPFLWPSLPQPGETVPRTLAPIITANPKNIGDRIYVAFMSLPVRFPAINRALNVGWISMLLTSTVFPQRFMDGSLYAFEEFLRRLRVGEDTTELLTPDFAKMLYDHLGEASKPANIEDGAWIALSKDGSMTIRDAWIFLGKPSSFSQSKGMYGGLLKSKDTHDPKSKTLFLQLPFTSVIQSQEHDVPLALQAEEGLQVAVDIQIKGTFKFGYKGEEMTQDRTAVVRFMSQAFEGRICNTTEDKNRRIFSIRDSIRWSIADIDYTWSERNWYDHTKD